MPKKRAKEMPAFTKAPEAVSSAFASAIDGLNGIERRTMFGYPSAFVNGNMFASVFQDRIMIRLPPAAREEALHLAGAKLFEPMPGRPMREYVELPPAVVQDAARLRGWVARGHEYAADLPAKRRPASRPTKPRRRL